MFLRLLIAGLLISCISCHTKPGAPLEFPRQAGQWKLIESTTVAKSGLDIIALRIQKGTYAGPGSATVYAHELSSETVAFEAVQRFRQGGKLTFYKGKQFITIESPDTARAVLAEFASALQQAMP